MADVNSKSPWRRACAAGELPRSKRGLLLDLALETKAVPEAVSTRLPRSGGRAARCAGASAIDRGATGAI